MNKKDLQNEIDSRVKWIKTILKDANAKGVVFGNSGGKDCAVAAALAKLATDNVIGVIMPCESIDADKEHALIYAEKFGIISKEVDLTPIYRNLVDSIEKEIDTNLINISKMNIKPRLRMTTLYAIAQQHGYLVLGTGNKSEITMGFFTKWGDGASDFNPLADLTVKEVLELGEALGVPKIILNKKPSAGLWPGQNDEDELGVSYKAIDEYLLHGSGNKTDIDIITSAYNKTSHKRYMPKTYKP